MAYNNSNNSNNSNGNRNNNSSNAAPKSTGEQNRNNKKNFRNKRRNFRPYDKNTKRRTYGNDNNNRKGPREANWIIALFRKYDYLMDVYLNARKKYFANFHTENENLKLKIERAYNSALLQFYTFEEKLTETEKNELNKRNNIKPCDTIVSEKVNESEQNVETETPETDIIN